MEFLALLNSKSLQLLKVPLSHSSTKQHINEARQKKILIFEYMKTKYLLKKV